MRFLILTLSPGEPSESSLERLGHFSRSLARAGVLIATGRSGPGDAVRLSVTAGRRVVSAASGAPQESAAFWVLQSRSAVEALEWARRAPLDDRGTIELRLLHEP